jgi:hypothetical protein
MTNEALANKDYDEAEQDRKAALRSEMVFAMAGMSEDELRRTVLHKDWLLSWRK